MINPKDNPVEWALLVSELEEAQEHINELLAQMTTGADFDESDYKVYLSHIYAHLNRAWNTKSKTEELSEEEWANHSLFPQDIDPIG